MVIFNALQATLSAGIGRYAYELSKAIYESHKLEFKIVIRKEDLNIFDFADINDLIIIEGINNGFGRNIAEQFYLPFIFKKYPNAVIHFPDIMCSFFCNNVIILTANDISFVKVKGVFTLKSMLWKKLSAWISLKKADKVIAISNFTNNEIKKYYKKTIANKSTMIYNSFTNLANEDIYSENVKHQIVILKGSKYILTVSTISPRKNMVRLIYAFNMIKNRTNANLVIAGGNGWMYDKVYETVDELHLTDRVIFTGRVNEDELKYLYKYANSFVYPSLYEGFGFPPLEAMGFGVPTAVSNVTSLPEITSGSSLYFNPSKSKDIAKKMLRLINDNRQRKALIAKGYNNIKRFSWDKCVGETINVYVNQNRRKS